MGLYFDHNLFDSGNHPRDHPKLAEKIAACRWGSCLSRCTCALGVHVDIGAPKSVLAEWVPRFEFNLHKHKICPLLLRDCVNGLNWNSYPSFVSEGVGFAWWVGVRNVWICPLMLFWYSPFLSLWAWWLRKQPVNYTHPPSVVWKTQSKQGGEKRQLSEPVCRFCRSEGIVIMLGFKLYYSVWHDLLERYSVWKMDCPCNVYTGEPCWNPSAAPHDHF